MTTQIKDRFKQKPRKHKAYYDLIKTNYNQYQASRDSCFAWFDLIKQRYPRDFNLHEMIEKMMFNMYHVGTLTERYDDYREDFLKKLMEVEK